MRGTWVDTPGVTKAMRKGLPFVLLAVMIAALVVPVGSALSLNAAADSRPQTLAWPAFPTSLKDVHADTVSRTLVVRPVAPSPLGPVSPFPESVRLFVAGVTLVGLAAIARLGR